MLYAFSNMCRVWLGAIGAGPNVIVFYRSNDLDFAKQIQLMFTNRTEWPNWVHVAARLAVASVIIGGLASLLVRLPNLPYNVRELFWNGGNLLNLWLFGGFVLWLGVGSALVALRVQHSRWPYLALPFWTIVVSTVSFVLLIHSVTPESINDIIGTRILTRTYVVNGEVGDDSVVSLIISGFQGISGWLEGIVRFTAVYAPIPIFTALALVWLSGGGASSNQWSKRLLLVLSALISLLLCKFIVVDVASTDNLTELISDSSFFGLSGITWLYVVVAVLCLNAAVLWVSLTKFSVIWISAVIILLSLPIAWFLFRLGLEGEVNKYGLRFSGAQFLLGQNRLNILSQWELFARWCAVHLGFITMLATGIRLALGSASGCNRRVDTYTLFD